MIILRKQRQSLASWRHCTKRKFRQRVGVIIVNAGTVCVHSFNGATFGKIGPIDQRL